MLYDSRACESLKPIYTQFERLCKPATFPTLLFERSSSIASKAATDSVTGSLVPPALEGGGEHPAHLMLQIFMNQQSKSKNRRGDSMPDSSRRTRTSIRAKGPGSRRKSFEPSRRSE